jgi:hypothetical protein
MPAKILIWSDHSKLNKNDFKGTPPAYTSHSAASKIGIETKIEPTFKGWNVTSYAYFDCSLSWLKSAHYSTELLKHEQGHFDLMQIAVLKILSELKKKSFIGKDVSSIVPNLTDSIYSVYKELELKYDLETNHSLNIENQKLWNKWISQNLDSISGGFQSSKIFLQTVEDH